MRLTDSLNFFMVRIAEFCMVTLSLLWVVRTSRHITCVVEYASRNWALFMKKLLYLSLSVCFASCSTREDDSGDQRNPMLNLEVDNSAIISQLDDLFPENMPLEEAKEKLLSDGFEVREQRSTSPNAMNSLLVGIKQHDSVNFMIGISVDVKTNLVIGWPSVTRY